MNNQSDQIKKIIESFKDEFEWRHRTGIYLDDEFFLLQAFLIKSLNQVREETRLELKVKVEALKTDIDNNDDITLDYDDVLYILSDPIAKNTPINESEEETKI